MRHHDARTNGPDWKNTDRNPERGRPRDNDRSSRSPYRDEAPRGPWNDRDGPEDPPDAAPEVRFGTGWRPAYEARVEHITATVWQREGVSGMAACSVTVTRRFFSQRQRSYLLTTKLFAEDAPLPAEALTRAYSWNEQQAAGH